MRKPWLGLLQWHLMGPKQPWGSLHTHPLEFDNLVPAVILLETRLNNQVEVRGAPESILDWITQRLLSVRIQQGKSHPKVSK